MRFSNPDAMDSLVTSLVLRNEPHARPSRARINVALLSNDRFEKEYEVQVCFNGDQAAYVVRSANGLPYVYSSSGFSICVDHKTPGRLLFARKGQPQVILRDDGPEITRRVAHSSRLLKPSINLDLSSALRRPGMSLVERSDTQASFREESMTIVASMSKRAFPVDRFTIERERAVRLEVFDIQVGEGELGLPLNVPGELLAEVSVPLVDTTDAPEGLSPFPPRDFGVNTLEIAASLEIQKLLDASIGKLSDTVPGGPLARIP